MISNIPVDLIQWFFSLVVLPSVAWFVSKRHHVSRQLKAMDTDQLKANIEIYQNMIDDVEERYKKMLAERDTRIDELEKEVQALKLRL